MWTRFMDMHSGGGLKEDQQYIYIEAPQGEAVVIFFNRFGHNPNRVTCTCCGEDYSINEDESLAQLTAYYRNCAWDEIAKVFAERQGKDVFNYDRKYLTVEKYEGMDDVLFIRANEIKPEERIGEVPEQGYVWVD